MATTQRGINIPVTGQFQDGDDIVDALIALGLSVDSAIGSAIDAAAASHNHDSAYYTKTQVDNALSGKSNTGHTHTAGDVTSGTFDAARIPNLSASKVTSGTFDAARIPNLPASKITSGTISPARLGSGTADNTRFLRGDGTWQVPPAGDGGVTDHGALTGLSDDDHPQYHNDERGDARYYTKTQVDTALTGKADAARGLPSGGSTGQVLAKASESDYDTEWVDPPDEGGGGVPDTGVRDVSDMVSSVNFHPSWGSVTLQRWGSLVTVSVLAFTKEWGPGSTTRQIIAIPAGFNPPSGGAAGALSGGNGDWTLDASGGNVYMTAPTGTPLPTNGMQFTGSLTYLTPDPWPTTLPGTSA